MSNFFKAIWIHLFGSPPATPACELTKLLNGKGTAIMEAFLKQLAGETPAQRAAWLASVNALLAMTTLDAAFVTKLKTVQAFLSLYDLA